ncbi:DUF563 domain-containing protein [Fibrella sp. WM1]|uniref:glycosyltransferase family 61 protein n=1 Tax=Fibrella musci TaxID=3242485 RepID=UPI003520B3E1
MTKAETEQLLSPFRLAVCPATTLALDQVVDLIDPTKIYFESATVSTEPVSVWHLDNARQSARQHPYGSIQLDRQLLCTDLITDDHYRNTLHGARRTAQSCEVLIAPWSHYLDGVVWGGYFDYVILVAAKLCRIKGAVLEAVFNRALIAYPLFDTQYERDFLALLNIPMERVVDSRLVDVSFQQCLLAGAGHWFYPNQADIQALRRYVLAQAAPPNGQRTRVYISRGGRRRVQNEAEVIELLRQYGFDCIADTPRSVLEQVAIYRNAEVIVGPHGASFSNIIWCQPGTHLLELFAPTYYPDFFRNLAQSLGMQYTAYFHGEAHVGKWTRGLEDDMYVSIPELKACLNHLLCDSDQEA